MQEQQGEEAPPSIVVDVGQVIAGKYRIDGELGRGGMGVVVAATHVQLGHHIAIKILTGQATRELVGRFLREARAAAKLKSDHVARVLDIGELPSGHPFIVMELLVGTDLADLLEKRRRLDPAEAAEYILQTCEGLMEAHDNGIIHRDLKPANLFLTTSSSGAPVIKILDFGISKQSDEAAPVSLTQTSAVMGTPLYMSPEQMRAARQASPRSDLWSLGVILYELVVGKTPFEGETYADLVLAVNTATPPKVDAMPERLDAVVSRCLAKNSAERYESASALAQALADYLALEPPRSLRRPFRPSEAPGVSIPSQALTAGPATPPRKNRLVLAVVGALLAIVGGTALLGAIIVVPRMRRSAPVQPTSEPASSSALAPPTSVPSVTPTPSVASSVGQDTPAAAPASSNEAEPQASAPASPRATSAKAAPRRPAPVIPKTAAAPAPAPPEKKSPFDVQLK